MCEADEFHARCRPPAVGYPGSMGSSREMKNRNAPVMSLAAAVAMALGAASCGGPAPPTYNDRSAEAPATVEAEPAEANSPQPVEPLAVEREIPLDRLLELPQGAVAETSLDPPLPRPSGVDTPESEAVLPQWLDVGVDIGSERAQAVDPGHDVHSKKLGVSLGWTGEREEEGKRGPTIAIEAEIREDTSEAHPDKETHDESIGLRVIVPFHAKGKADSR